MPRGGLFVSGKFLPVSGHACCAGTHAQEQVILDDHQMIRYLGEKVDVELFFNINGIREKAMENRPLFSVLRDMLETLAKEGAGGPSDQCPYRWDHFE